MLQRDALNRNFTLDRRLRSSSALNSNSRTRGSRWNLERSRNPDMEKLEIYYFASKKSWKHLRSQIVEDDTANP